MKDLKKEFLGSRTSWRYFDRMLKGTNVAENNSFTAWQIRILLEILKELQYLNNK